MILSDEPVILLDGLVVLLDEPVVLLDALVILLDEVARLLDGPVNSLDERLIPSADQTTNLGEILASLTARIMRACPLADPDLLGRLQCLA